MAYVDEKPKLEQNLKMHLHDAAKAAFLESKSGASSDQQATCDANTEQFAEKFATKFANEAAPKLAQDIFDFCMGIEIVLAPASQGLIAPQAPSGTLPVQGSASTSAGDFSVM